MLTEAGSVFVFTVLDAAKAKEVLQSWRDKGLPLPRPVVDAYGGTWCDHPCLPQNGYGEIAVAPAHGFPSL